MNLPDTDEHTDPDDLLGFEDFPDEDSEDTSEDSDEDSEDDSDDDSED